MKVYIILQEENDCPIGPDGDEYYYEWKNVIKVVDSQEKAELECKDHWDYSYQVHDVQ